MSTPLLEIRDLRTTYTTRHGFLEMGRSDVQAAAGIDLHIEPGETVGLVGESGCGKTSVARSIVGLVRPRSGQILFEGEDLLKMSRPHSSERGAASRSCSRTPTRRSTPT